MKKLFILLIALCTVSVIKSATYYSQSSGALNSTSRWNTARNGSGSTHDAMYGNTHTYIIQNGHSITSSSSPNVGNGSSSMIIENGGTYTHTSATTSTLTLGTLRIEGGGLYQADRTGQTITTLNIYANGKYIHNSGSNALPGTNRNFLNSNNGGNGNGTYEIRNHGASAISAQPSWGNLIINRSGGVVAFSTSQTIAGNLEITAGTLNLSTITTHTTASLSFVGTNQSGGSWGSTASSATRKNNTYFTTGITGIINNTSAVLPINLLSFDGFKNDGYNTLYWSTASEFNNDFFTIEKTTDGNTYNIVGIVNGSGDSQILNNYELQDFNLEKTINYYRLKQTDYNGKYKYSDIISIDNRDKLSPTLIKVSNTLGQEVNDYTDGVYMFYYDDGSMVRRFVK